MKELQIEQIRGGEAVKVVKQTHRCGAFGEPETGGEFIAEDGFILRSKNYPEAKLKGEPCGCIFKRAPDDLFYVRGIIVPQDDRIVMVPNPKWLRRLLRAVEEYNERFKET